ncbi:nuclear transport factor 2 family protein [Pseudohoeflea coraliihabitans]|uniref:Nuclear transport factor 2 family protein n=1 Tax=Pseudohoeflea coraliihabitans TaxID=2860393 RepID=A0ABS6WJD8_9HYPH|nr:nuclear transport factor 2 family protein [Pseudohoeflea sp. DP4N28-3]MBW3096058.1 nuclear transport factor 2 family protein [Pseudohoeflea sp. DP4N28-3]
MTMPDVTIDLISRFLAAYSARNIDDMLDCFGEDAALDITNSERVIGRRQIRFALAERLKQFEERVGDIVIMTTENGSRAAAEFTLRGRYRSDADELPPASGQDYALAAGVFCEAEDAGLSRLSLRFNPVELRRQVSGH